MAHRHRQPPGLGEALFGLAFLVAAACGACNPNAFDDLSRRRPGDAGGLDAGTAEPPTDSSMRDAGQGEPMPQTDAAAQNDGTECEVVEVEPGLGVSRVRYCDLGPLPQPARVTARLTGPSAVVGERILWLFPQTRIDGNTIPTAAWSSLESPWDLEEMLDSAGAPRSLFERTPQESEHIWFLPGSVIAANENAATIFYGRFAILNMLDTRVGLLPKDTATASRSDAVMFEPGESKLPAFYLGAVTRKIDETEYVHLYACEGTDPHVACRVARAPLSHAADPAAYAFWHENEGQGSYGPDITKATYVLTGLLNEALSVSFNAFLDRFVAVYSIVGNRIRLMVAQRPEGPWSKLADVPTMISEIPLFTSHRAHEHPALHADGGATTFVTYTKPLEADGFTLTRTEEQVMRLQFE